MRSLGGWLLLLAIIAGTGYAVYVVKLSGSTAQRLALALKDDRAPDTEVGPVSLEPSMNPLRALLKLDLHAPSDRRELFRHEVALLSSGGDTLWEEEGLYRQSSQEAEKRFHRTRSITVPIKDFEIAEAGEYRLRLWMRPRDRVDIKSAALEIRQNVAGFSPRIWLRDCRSGRNRAAPGRAWKEAGESLARRRNLGRCVRRC